MPVLESGIREKVHRLIPETSFLSASFELLPFFLFGDKFELDEDSRWISIAPGILHSSESFAGLQVMLFNPWNLPYQRRSVRARLNELLASREEKNKINPGNHGEDELHQCLTHSNIFHIRNDAIWGNFSSCGLRCTSVFLSWRKQKYFRRWGGSG